MMTMRLVRFLHLLPRSRRILLAILPLLFLSLALDSAYGQNLAALNTRSYSPLPEGASIWVEALDDSDFNLSIQELFTRALGRSGLAGESAAARLNLTFDSLDRFEVGKRDYLGEVKQDKFSETSLRLNMWSTTRDSLLNRHQSGSLSGRFLIVAILYDNEAQRRLWEAEASAPASMRDNKKGVTNLVFRIVDQLGKTIRQEALSLD